MKSEHQECIETSKNEIKRNTKMALFLSPFVVVEGYVFYIYFLKLGFSITTFGCLGVCLGMLIVVLANLYSILIERRLIKLYETHYNKEC
jgi:hypothetical protein